MHFFVSDCGICKIQNIKEYVPQALGGIPHLIVGENENAVPIAFMGFDGQK
jgi:putative acetyltransferase